MTSLRAALVVTLAALLSSCGAHVLEDGSYALTATEVFRDECGLVASPEALWDATLRIDGEHVRMKLDLFEIELRGVYREMSEGFYVDGTAANMVTQVRGETCRLDLATVHLDASTEASQVFNGTMRVQYWAHAAEACECEAWLSFRAEKTGN